MSVPYTRITLPYASRVSSSYTEQIGCISCIGTRTCSVRRNDVRGLFSLPMFCVSSPKTNPSSLFANHVSSSY